jgi:hypothetical protein
MPQSQSTVNGDIDLTRKVARDYLARGWAPIEIGHRTKAPYRKGWLKTQITTETVDKRIVGNLTNIGIALGDLSAGLVDVDLDWPEARRLAPRIMPTTGARFGRHSSPSSHWL